jgi:hypothetical protein
VDREAIKVERSPSHCPFCKGTIDDLREVVACAECVARHHRDCHAENGGRCATCGGRALLAPVVETLGLPKSLPVAAPPAPEPLPVLGSEVPVESDLPTLDELRVGRAERDELKAWMGGLAFVIGAAVLAALLVLIIVLALWLT